MNHDLNDLALRLCLGAYPGEVRKRDGRVIIDLARDLSTQGGVALLREVTGLVLGGIRIRGRMLRLRAAAAPWTTARRSLTLPLAVALFSLILSFVLSSPGPWKGWWALLMLAASAATVLGAVSSRRFPTVTGSLLVAFLMVFDALRELGTHTARWIGNVAIGQVSVFAMWLPAAALLVFCATAVQSGERQKRDRATCIICLPISIAILLVLALRPLSPDLVKGIVGGVLVYGALALAAAGALAGAIRKDSPARTSAALLLGTGYLPAAWLVAMILPELSLSGSYHLVVPLVYYLTGFTAVFLLACGLLCWRLPQSAAAQFIPTSAPPEV